MPEAYYVPDLQEDGTPEGELRHFWVDKRETEWHTLEFQEPIQGFRGGMEVVIFSESLKGGDEWDKQVRLYVRQQDIPLMIDRLHEISGERKGERAPGILHWLWSGLRRRGGVK